MYLLLGPATQLIKDGLIRPSELAWDWLGRNFYFFSEGYIHACNYNGSYCTELLATGLTEIKSLLVLPTEGFMFFSVWGETQSSQYGFVERANLDGLDARRVISQVIS